MTLLIEVPIKKKKYGVAAKYFDESNMDIVLKKMMQFALLYLRLQYFSILS